jgi:hypothetical protein
VSNSPSASAHGGEKEEEEEEEEEEGDVDTAIVRQVDDPAEATNRQQASQWTGLTQWVRHTRSPLGMLR